MKNQGQSVLKGSLILLIANFMVKVIGAAFKIPLTNLIGNEGMGYFNAAYQIYSGLFIIATAGLPVAVSKMVSESIAKNNLRETKRIFKSAYFIFLIIGIAGSCALFFGAETFSATTKFKHTEIVVRTIAPALLFVSLMSVYRGFFQGTTNMYPTAISEVVEALGKLIIGFAAAYILLPKGLHISAAGAIFGVTSGTFFGFLILMFIYINNKKIIYKDIRLSPAPRSYKDILWNLLKIAVPITISASVFTLTNLIDTFFIGNNLDKIQHLLSETPGELYGKYTSKAVVLYNMPPTLVMSLCLALVPAIARAYVKKDNAVIRSTTTQSLKMTLFFSVPCTVGLFALAEPILVLLYGTNDAVTLLQLISPAVVFVSMVLVTNAVLQATGHVMIPVINIAAGGIVKLIVNISLVSLPAININGAPIGTALCYFVYMTLNLIYIRKITKADIGFSFWIKPVFSGIVMCAAATASYRLACGFVNELTRMGAFFSLIFSGGVCVLIYFTLLFITGGITKEDVSVMPKGKTLVRILSKLHLIK